MKFSKRIGLFFAVNVLLFVCMLIIRWPWINENFLIADDLIFIPKTLFGQGAWMTSGFAGWFVMNNALEFFKDVAKVRFLYLLLFSMSATFLYFALRKVINDNFYPLLILLMASLFPVYADQAIFINGSHPLLGMVFVLVAIASLFFLVLSERKKAMLLWSLLAGFMFFISLYCTPTTALVSLSGMILLLYPMPKTEFVFKRIMLISSSILPPFIRQIHLKSLGISYNHYSGIEGWTIITPENMVAQLMRSMKIFFATMGVQLFVVIVLILVITIIIKFTFSTQDKIPTKKKELIVLSVFFLTISALYFSPVSILGNVQIRYLLGPIFFATLALGVILYFLFGNHKYARIFFLAGLGIICLMMISVSRDYAKQRFSFSVERQKTIQSFVKDKVDEWEPEAQVVFVLDKMPPSFTSGFNHWSTWYLRYITNRTDLIGIIGHKSWLNYNPVIKKYREHGPEFWTTVKTKSGPRSVRKKMIGIEEKRPTYIYVEEKDGAFVQYNQILIFEDDKYQLFSADKNGLALVSKNPFDFYEMCSGIGEKKDTTLVFGSPVVEPYVPSEIFNKAGVVYDGRTSHKLKIPKGKRVNIEMDISSFSSDDAKYSSYTEVSPPMPFLWGKIAVYQVGPKIYRAGHSTIAEQDGRSLINIRVFDKCGYMVNSSNGNASVGFGDYFSGSPIVVGKGFKNRYWKGKFNALKATIIDQNNNSTVLTMEDIKKY